jgi:protein HIRA/HIR1
MRGTDDELNQSSAIGSMDCGLSVWATNSPRPIFVAQSCFGDCVLDLSWTSNGRGLAACSSEGTIAYIVFTTSEI